MIVIDTTIAVKWVVDEDARQTALAILDRNDILIAPDFMLAETAHVLRKKARNREITLQQMIDGVVLVKEAIAEFLPTSDLIEDALALSSELDHSPYDCCFMACALGRGVLLTADEVFSRKCRSKGYGRVVADLTDVESGRLDAALSVGLIGGDVLEPVLRLAPLISQTFAAVRAEGDRTDSGLVVLSSLRNLADPSSSPTYRSMQKTLSTLNQDQLAVLLALGWLGRDYYHGHDWGQLLENAMRGSIAAQPELHSAYFLAQMNAVPTGLAKLRAHFDIPE